ncbi:MAG: DUF2851 family protein [Bacteroidales bacterium]|nr:DUF2851 family protein [Bacteroidales bacterium]
MNEQFICYLWQNRLITGNLTLTNGEPLQVIHPGTRNQESGPDFFNARIKIGATTVWAGNVEIHLKSSDWTLHKHHEDKNYDCIVLHVVFKDNTPVYYSNNQPVPTLEVADRFDEKLLERYEQMIAGKGFIPCAESVASCDDFVVLSWLENIAADRLIKRQKEIEALLERTKNDWDTSYYIRFFRNFGFKVNAEPFEILGRTLPLLTLLKHADNRSYIEAILYGMAGVLEDDFEDEYPKMLQKEFDFFRKKYTLTPMAKHLWKFMRTHPGNFPTIRLSQLAEIVQSGGVRFSEILQVANIAQLEAMFQVKASSYWNSHYRFDKTSPQKQKSLGENAINLLLINTIIPFIFAYGHIHKELSYCEKAILFFQQLPPEDNVIIRHWAQSGIKAANAMESQALIHLKQNYCVAKKCLQCRIGDYLLRST